MSFHYVPFQPWGASHIAILAGSFLVPVVLSLIGRRFRSPGLDAFLRKMLAMVVLLSWLGWYIAGYARGWLDVGNALPLNLCDWAAAATALALLTRRQGAFDLAYFWALGGTLQALISPDVRFDFPEIRMVQFTGFHGGIIAGALYLCFSGQMRPFPSSLWRVGIATAVYALCAGAADAFLGVNYGFLRAKPDIVSAMSGMPPWPYYLPVLAACAVVVVLFWYAPFYIRDLRAGARRKI